MEWNRNNSNGTIAPPHSQQYLLPSTSSMVANGQGQMSSVQQNSIVKNGSYNPSKDPLLQNLLQARSEEDFLKIQQAALGKLRHISSNRQTNPMKSSHHISSYKSAQEAVPVPDNRSALAVQNTVGSNYRMPTYVNPGHQIPQQTSVIAGQQFGGNGFNATSGQQPLQNTQALQNYQGTVTYTYPQQNNLYNSVRPPATATQMPCQQMVPNVPASTVYNLQTGSSGQFISNQNVPAQTNLSAPMQEGRNSQNIANPSLAQYRSIPGNRLSHVPQQQMSVPQLQTLPQLDRNANCYTQSQQRQNLQTVSVNNSPQIASSAAAKMPPTYTQALTSQSNVFNASMNQNFSQPRQNYVVPNVQQPAQSGNPPPAQSFVGDEQSRVRDLISSQERNTDMLKLLLVYRNVRKKYELLNQENNLLRQRLQASTSQENTGAPPLLSSLPTAQPPANCVMPEQQNVAQAVPAQNSAQINSAKSFLAQNFYDKAGIQCNLSLQDNAAVQNQTFTSENGNHLGQNNYSVFDGGQARVANGLTSALQLTSPETLTTKAGQEVPSREFRGQTNSNNQYESSLNSNNGNVLQNGHAIHSLDKPAIATQGLNPACPNTNGYEHLSSYTNGLTGNGQGTSVSREAIEASLPLWKAVSQSSSQSTNRSSETQHNQSPVDSPLAALRLLDEMTSGPTNEVSSAIPVQKQDLAAPNQVNPQIAIVSPLVQSKEALQEDYQLSKVCIQSPDVESTTINGLINSHESDCFNKILQALESLGASTINNVEASRSKEPPVATQDDVNSALPSCIEASSPTEIKIANEIVDDNLQISGICTLVEGNSFYNSAIALMFDETSKTTTLPHTDTRDDNSKTVDTSFISNAPCSTSPKEVPAENKSEPVAEVVPKIERDLHCNEISCNDIQVDQHMVSVQQESCCDPESNAVSDQLSELLTEFPYGIKNYISKNILTSTNSPSGKTTDKPVLEVSAVLEDSEPIDESKAIDDTQSEVVPSPSVKLQHVAEMDADSSMNVWSPADPTVQQTTERVPTPAKEVDVGSLPEMDTCSDDGFEILSNSSVSDLQITLLDQDEIPKIFPDENKNVGSEHCREIKLEVLPECSNTSEPETESDSVKKEPSDVTETATDTILFCCVLSWLAFNDKNAAKCNCKPLESSKVESTLLFNNSASFLKTGPSPKSPEQTLQGLPKQNNGGIIGLEILQSPDRPPRLDLVDSDNEILHPHDKPPKLEKIVSESEHVQKPSHDFSPKAERALTRSASLESFQSVKNSLKNYPVNHEKSSIPSPGNGARTFRKSKDQNKSLKSRGSRKREKLIVKTDFLKSKHPYKEHRKTEDTNATDAAQWASNKSGYSKNSPGEPEKKSRGEERVEQNRSTLRVEQSPEQQADRSCNRQKSSHSVDRSSHSQGVKKRKEKETHFEKTRKVPTVQEYLERKRELCKKRTEASTESREGLGDVRHTTERPEVSGNPHLDRKRPSSPVETVTSEENRLSETSKGSYRKDRPQRGSPHEAGHRRQKDLHDGQKVSEKTENMGRSSSKNKIYLTPCVGSRRASYEGINLAKLQIRHTPDIPKSVGRRRSLESSGHTKHSSSAAKNIDSPKMLEFKLYPDFAHGSPITQEKFREASDSEAKTVVESIKSSKEAWCNSIPLKKRKVESVEGQGFHKLPALVASTPQYKPLEKNTTRPPQDSRTTFNVFKQMYHEQRSKSLDCSQGNS